MAYKIMIINNTRDLAIVLQDYRKQQGLSQKAAAELVGLRQATISHFESKPDKATIETLFKMLSAAGVKMHIEPVGKEISAWEEEW